MLGGIARPKGTLILLRALPRLVEKAPDVRLVIAGPPPAPLKEPGMKGFAKRLLGVDRYQQKVQQTLKALPENAREAVVFTGVRTDIPEMLAASTCLVFPSVAPHFARPIIEAAAMGLPSVASDLGGPRELVAHEETGLLVPPSDPEALADALIELLTQPEKSRQMGEAAYQRARRFHDARQNAAETIALYTEIFSPGQTDIA
jgi:glycosyltransferase involved in cell wall biosynthesis